MGWIVGGFITAILLETIIRILSGYEPIEKEKAKRTVIDIPWYGKSLLGIWVWKWLTKKER